MPPPRSPRPAWLPDELRHAGRENLDANHVAHYDEKEDAGAEEEVALLRDLGLGPASHQWGRADVDEHIRDEHSTFSWLLEPMIDRSGFTIERAEHSEDGVLAAYVLRAADS